MVAKKKSPKAPSTRKKTIKAKTQKVTKAAKVAKIESFKLSKEQAPFMSFHFTMQTVYWLILLVFVLVLSLWVLHLQNQVSTIINSINQL
jgi:type VI protein secretion system component VasF